MKTLPGRYKHYKGQMYDVLHVASHSETLESMVIYRALYGSYKVCARPECMFKETVVLDGRKVPRFKLLGD